MLTRRLFSFGGLAAVAGLPSIGRARGRQRGSVALRGVAIGIGPLIVNVLEQRPPVRAGIACGCPAVFYEGRFLGWLPGHAHINPSDSVELESVRRDRSGKVQIYVTV